MAHYGSERWRGETNEDSEYLNDGNKRKSNRVQRACYNCRKRKQGCEDERPCKRCVEKGIPCEEVQMKKRGRAKAKTSPSKIKDEYHHDHTHSHESPDSPEDEYFAPNESSSDPSSDEEIVVTSHPSHEISQHPLDLCHSHEDLCQQLEEPEAESPRNSFGPLLPFLINVVAQNDKKLLGPDLVCESRFLEEPTSDSGDEEIEEGCELFDEIRCWWETNRSQLQVDEKMRGDLSQVQDLWQTVLRDLRNMQWRRVKSTLQRLESQENQAMGSSPAMIVWSAGGLIHHANEAFCNLAGYGLQELEISNDAPYTPHPRLVASSLFDDVSIWKNQLEVVGQSHRSAYHLKTRLLSKDGREIPVTLSVANLRDSLGLSLLTIAHVVPNLGVTSRVWNGYPMHQGAGIFG
eukprot:TRINITY_DN1198_c0_g1_i1.p1 TRINITY_DN1198_c0_g1~~TRINITY_DN1198_c0_g1_i1.p1  ORF type:complete len:405 (+),score=51.57 TRINITY_DN1198_c0_g1_i1:702-1916(+)